MAANWQPKPIYCPRRHGIECDTPNACAGGADCRFGPDPATQRTDRTEPTITINSVPLTTAQAMTMRVALESFATDLHNHGLGDDHHGTTMTHAYLAAIKAIRVLMQGQGDQ